MGLVRDLNSRMAQLPPLFEDSQMLDEYELVHSLFNKALKTHKAMLISHGFNTDTANLETFALAMSSVVSARSQCSTKVSRFQV